MAGTESPDLKRSTDPLPRVGLEVFGMMIDRRRHAGLGGFTTSDARVTEHLFRALLFRTSEEFRLELLGVGPLLTKPDELEVLRARRIRYRRLPAIPDIFLIRTLGVRLFQKTLRDRIYPRCCASRGYSLLHYTGTGPWGDRPLAEQELLMAYDLFPERSDPGMLAATRRRLASRRDTLWVSAISTFTARDMVEMLDLPAERVVSIPLAVDHSIYQPAPGGEDEKAKLARRFPDGYVLFVGSFATRKNFLTLARAMEAINHRRAVPLTLVMAGPELGAPLRMRQQVRAQVHALFKKTPFVEILRPTDEEMAALYRGARLLAHPALFEGFGLTVLEAMACGCPVVCGRHSSLTEVGGDAAEYVDDVRNIEEFVGAIERLADSPSRADERRRSGLEQAAPFTWERFECETVALYRRILGHPPEATV